MKKKSETKKTLTLSLSIILGALILLIMGVFAYFFAPNLDIFRYYEKANLHYYNDNENTGYLSTIYEGKIYFYSNEQDGVNGIYTMNPDASDVELLIECPDVKRITVNEDGIFFVGLYKIYNETKYRQDRMYGLFKSKDFYTVERKMPELLSIYDFYLFEDEFLSVSEIYDARWGPKGKAYIIQNDANINPFEDEVVLHEIYVEEKKSPLLSIKQYKDIPVYFSKQFLFPDTENADAYYHYGTCAFGTIRNNETVSYNMLGNNEMRYIPESNEIVCGYKGEIYIINLDDYIVDKKIEVGLSKPDWEDYRFVYTITGCEGVNFYIKTVIYDGVHIKNIKYFIVNYTEGTYEEILSLENDNKSVLYFDSEQMIIKEGNKIYSYKIDSDNITDPKLLTKIKEDELDVTKAGDWLFLYSIHSDKTYLLYKINIVTGEVFENTVPFDSTQHDEIYIDEMAP